MWFEFLFEGVRKFAGEIIGLILLAIFWRKFPRLWKWVSEHKNLNKDDNAEVRQALKNIQRQLEAERRERERMQAEVRRKEEALKQAEAQKAEEEKRRAEVQRQLEAQRQEQERIQAEIRRKEKLSQEEARKLQEALRKSEVKQKTAVKKQSAMSGKKFLNLCMSGGAKKVEEAIMNGANVNAKDKYDYTALMLAVENGHKDTAKILINHGADVNAKRNDGNTALMQATAKHHTDTANLLRKYGAI